MMFFKSFLAAKKAAQKLRDHYGNTHYVIYYPKSSFNPNIEIQGYRDTEVKPFIVSDFSSRDENIYIAYGSFSQSTSALLRLANPEAYSGLSIKFDDLPDSLSESIYNEKCLPFPRSDGDASLTV